MGILPGLGGAATLALMLPFIYQMNPVTAFAFLLGSNAVTATTGDVPSILFGVPGEGISAATVVDGHPMAKRGDAGRALAIWLLGFNSAVPIATFLYLKIGAHENWLISGLLAVILWVFFFGLFDNFLHLPFPEGLLVEQLGI